MREFSRTWVTAAVAAVAVTGFVTVGTSWANAAQPAATAPISTLSGPFTCRPAELRAEAMAHDQKSAEYQAMRSEELAKNQPDQGKAAYYDDISKTEKRIADANRAKAKQCEDLDENP